MCFFALWPPNDNQSGKYVYSNFWKESDHPSAHVYHQLIKRDAMPSEVTSIQPYVNYETPKCAKNLRRPENAASPASETNSNWSIRFSKSSPLRRVIDCVVSSRSNDSVTRLCQSTPPPQLPDRSYGQSTVNLVYRVSTTFQLPNWQPYHVLLGIVHRAWKFFFDDTWEKLARKTNPEWRCL